MKLACLISVTIFSLASPMASAQKPAAGPWDQPAASLAEDVASILGPGQARLVIHNSSTISVDQIPAIRHLLEAGLRSHGVLASGAESANTIRVTLSENLRERLWVAEIIEGTEIRVAMVHVAPGAAQQQQSGSGVTLRKQSIFTTGDEVLAALGTSDGLILVEPEQIVIETRDGDGGQAVKNAAIGQSRPLVRDPRAVILPSADGSAFDAYVAGRRCSGTSPGSKWIVHCYESDDPWPVTQSSYLENLPTLKAFLNTSRNYFTGVVTPSLGVDLPPFYAGAFLPRPDGTAFLINGIDGKVQSLVNGKLRLVAGTRDWGSDFVALQTGCGSGTQIVASGSGEALNDSLRAFDLPAQEAIPSSAPLSMDGTVTALATAPDRKSLIAIVRTAANQYEGYRVSASCN